MQKFFGSCSSRSERDRGQVSNIGECWNMLGGKEVGNGVNIGER